MGKRELFVTDTFDGGRSYIQGPSGDSGGPHSLFGGATPSLQLSSLSPPAPPAPCCKM